MTLSLRQRISAIAWCSFIYVFLEWLFLVSKPSFFNYFPWLKSIEIYFIGALLFFTSLLGLFLLLGWAIWAIEKVLFRITGHALDLQQGLLVYFLALVLLILSMLLVDNFSYTLFELGIIDTTSASQFFYCLFLIAVFIYLIRTLKKTSLISVVAKNAAFGYGSWIFLLSSCVLLFLNVFSWKEYSPDKFVADRKYPNIVFFASDGIEADHMSFYGYHRETTPNLDKLKSSMLVVENAFSNASQTTGATTALLTGKYPARTKVFFPPHFLKNKSSYQHLPGILKKLGYYNVQIAVSWWADATELNFVEAFDVVNERKISNIRRNIPFEFHGNYLFLKALAQRPLERIRHLLGLEKMINPYRELMPTERRWPIITDATRFSMLEEAIGSDSAPFFLHLHLNDSHGVRCIDQDCEYDLNNRYFSLPHEEITSENRVDFYDDAVADSDRLFQKLLVFLEEKNLLKNTIFVISSDHSAVHTMDQRIPLIFIFPGQMETGRQRMTSNAELLDVAPTVLDYLGIKKPQWMDGKSLLAGDQDPMRKIFGLGVIPDEGGKPPLYGLETYALTTCQRHYLLTLATLDLAVVDVDGHTAPCPESQLLTNEEARQEIIRHLNDFDIEAGAGQRR